jgi:predicted solute-binding protein
MFNEFLKLYSNPIFKSFMNEYVSRMQEDGLEAAKKFWNLNPEKGGMFAGAPEFIEKMTEFYSGMGFVTRKKYDELASENDDLKRQNAFLRDTIRQLNIKVFEEGGKNLQEAWKTTMDKQLELSKDLAKNFFELFKGVK